MELSHKHQVFLTVSIVAILFAIILFLMVPAIKGYNLNKDFEQYGLDPKIVLAEMDKLGTDLKISEFHEETCQASKEEYLSRISTLTNESYNAQESLKEKESELRILDDQCKKEKEALKVDLESESRNLRDQNSKLSEELENIGKLYESIMSNAANNICCKYKVDFPSTDSYFISNDRIVCANGEDNKIDCS